MVLAIVGGIPEGLGTLRVGGIRGYEQFIGVECEGDAVVLVHGDHVVQSQSEVGRDEIRIVVAIIDLTTDVGDVQTQRKLTLTTTHIHVGVVESAKVYGKGRARLGAIVEVTGDVGIKIAEGDGGCELLAQHARVGSVDGPFVRLKGHGYAVGAVGTVAGVNLTEREVAQRSTHGLVVAQAGISHEVSLVDVVDNAAQPRGIVEGHAGTTDGEGILGGIPCLRVDVRVGGSTHISHTAGTGIGGDALRHDGCLHGIELVFLVLCLGEHAAQQEGKGYDC